MNAIGELLSVGTALCWTITVISFEYAGKRVGSIPVNIIRLVFGFIFLGLFLLFTRGMFLPLDATQYAWTMLMISGFVGLVIGDLFLFRAFVEVGGRISLLIMSLVPLISALLGYLFFNEVITGWDLVGMAVTLVFIVVVILSRKQKNEPLHKHVKRGILFALIGAFGQAIGLILSKEGMGGDYNAFAATQIRIIAAMAGFTIFIFIRRDWKRVGKAFLNKKAIGFIVLGSFFGPFLGVSTSLLALQYTDLGIATTIAQLNVIMIIPFSIVLFKERVNIIEILGALGAFAGVTVIILL